MFARTRKPVFNVQKHRASRLHYDFRLEIGDVLKSWAVPKGPSMDPAVKRLALQVEDHDPGYADFEGMIEEGRYGAGPVLVWDTGWFETAPGAAGESAETMLARGALDVILHGHRLKGRVSLFEMKGKPGQWRRVKQKDREARPGHEVTGEQATSVLTGRTLEDLEREAAAGRLKTYRGGG
jgi:bifunctional non-homologous end joining protein LigD